MGAMTEPDRVSAPTSIRPATLDDLPAIRAILAAHGNDGPIENGDIVGPYLGHLIGRHVARVSERDGAVVAFAAAVRAGVSRHLADLFVRQDLLGQGIGRPLLDSVLDGDDRRTTFASDDPRAMPLYIRAGMRPYWPQLYLRGDANAIRAPHGGLAVEPAPVARLAELELRWTGIDRRVDHDHWGTVPDADPFVITDGGEAVAFGLARARQAGPNRILDRLLVRADADPTPIILVAVVRAARGGPVVVAVPGPNLVLPELLAAGFRIDDHDTFMTSDPGLLDPARFLPNSGLL
jgi:GNAT superfamily N-acetyltransferase